MRASNCVRLLDSAFPLTWIRSDLTSIEKCSSETSNRDARPRTGLAKKVKRATFASLERTILWKNYHQTKNRTSPRWRRDSVEVNGVPYRYVIGTDCTPSTVFRYFSFRCGLFRTPHRTKPAHLSTFYTIDSSVHVPGTSSTPTLRMDTP